MEDVNAEKSGPLLAWELCSACTAVLQPTSQRGFRHAARKDPCTPAEVSSLLRLLPPRAGSVSHFMGELSSLRDIRDSSSHYFNTPEALVLAIQEFIGRQMLPVIMNLGMHFAHAILSNCQRFSDELLGPSRVLQLAALSLTMAKSQCFGGIPSWKWSDWVKADQDVARFVEQLLTDAPGHAQAFAVIADDIGKRALQTGPEMSGISFNSKTDCSGRSLNIEQLQMSVQLCCQAGFLNAAVRSRESAAALLLDVSPGRLT